MSQSKIYVGNLSYNTTEDELRDYFSEFGNIEDIKLIIDFKTGRSKGFAFVTYVSDQDCDVATAKAIDKANGADLGGRKLKVNIARDDNSKSRRPVGNGMRRSFNNRDRGDRGYRD